MGVAKMIKLVIQSLHIQGFINLSFSKIGITLHH